MNASLICLSRLTEVLSGMGLAGLAKGLAIWLVLVLP